MRKGGTLVMEQQTVEVRFKGELVGSYSEYGATYTLYRVPDDMYVVHIDKGDESWLETHGGRGLNEGMVRTFFPELAAATGLD
jgi:hypothetical protein